MYVCTIQIPRPFAQISAATSCRLVKIALRQTTLSVANPFFPSLILMGAGFVFKGPVRVSVRVRFLCSGPVPTPSICMESECAEAIVPVLGAVSGVVLPYPCSQCFLPEGNTPVTCHLSSVGSCYFNWTNHVSFANSGEYC